MGEDYTNNNQNNFQQPFVITQGQQIAELKQRAAQKHRYQMQCYIRLTLILYTFNFLCSLSFILGCMEKISEFEAKVRKTSPKFNLAWLPDLLLIPFIIPCLVYFLISFRVLWYWNYTPKSTNIKKYKRATKFSNCWTNCLLWCYLTMISPFFIGAFYCWHKIGSATGEVLPKVWLIAGALFLALGLLMLVLNIMNVFCYCLLICYHRKVRKSIEFFEGNPDYLTDFYTNANTIQGSVAPKDDDYGKDAHGGFQ